MIAACSAEPSKKTTVSAPPPSFCAQPLRCRLTAARAGRTELDPADTVSIRRRCERIVPSLKDALVCQRPPPRGARCPTANGEGMALRVRLLCVTAPHTLGGR
jgi:hypothetical protein